MTTFEKGSQGEAVALALSDETFLVRAAALARTRDSLFRELQRAETWHHEMRDRLRCVSTSRLSAGSGQRLGYLSAWFELAEFSVQLDFTGAGGQLTADLVAFESRAKVYDNGRALHVERVENKGWGRENVDRLGFSWRAGNPRFWQAIALVRETTHPMLCGVCLCARVDPSGEACGCEAAADVAMSFSAAQR